MCNPIGANTKSLFVGRATLARIAVDLKPRINIEIERQFVAELQLIFHSPVS
ncbi:MAG: hypothetical protein WAZ77_14650 [Candidatus Nitrosopolaris sp.]